MVSWSCVEISCCLPNCTAPCFHSKISLDQAILDFESSIVSKCKVPSASKSESSSRCCLRAHKHYLYSIAPPLSSPDHQTQSSILPQATVMANETMMATKMSSHFTGFIAATSPPPTPSPTSMTSSPATSPITSPSSTTPTRLRSLSKLQIPQQPLLPPQQLSQPPSPLQLKGPSKTNSPRPNQQPTTATSTPSPSPFRLLTQHLLKVPELSQNVSPLSTTYMPRSGTSISPMSARGSPRSTKAVLGSPYSGRTPFSTLTTGSMGGSPLALSNVSSPVLAM